MNNDNKVEYKSTITVEFITKAYDIASGDVVDVIPDSYSAKLESVENIPRELADLPVEVVNNNRFLVDFYASPDTSSEVYCGNGYYVVLYYSKDLRKYAERQMIIVVPDKK